MWQMYAIICAVTMMECNVMDENPSRTFQTKAECQEAALIKEKFTRDMLTDEDGYLTVAHLEVGCERKESI